MPEKTILNPSGVIQTIQFIHVCVCVCCIFVNPFASILATLASINLCPFPDQSTGWLLNHRDVSPLETSFLPKHVLWLNQSLFIHLYYFFIYYSFFCFISFSVHCISFPFIFDYSKLEHTEKRERERKFNCLSKSKHTLANIILSKLTSNKGRKGGDMDRGRSLFRSHICKSYTTNFSIVCCVCQFIIFWYLHNVEILEKIVCPSPWQINYGQFTGESFSF